MTWNPYNGFSGEEREKFSRVQTKAIKNGILKPEEETKCIMCGQDKCIKIYHVENYFPERIVENSTPLCLKCHKKYHNLLPDKPEKFRAYLETVREIPSKPSYNKTFWLPDRDKVLDSYNGFSPDEREASKEIIAEALENGDLKPLKESECSICGQNKGLREYHIEDYSSKESIIDSAKPVCWTCHQYIHHQKEKNPEIFERYVEEVKKVPRDPVYITNVWLKEDE